MPRVGSDRGQIGLDQMGSDWTDLDWIDLTQMEIRLDEMGSDQIGSDRLRFPLDCRYLRVRDVRYPHLTPVTTGIGHLRRRRKDGESYQMAI